MPPKLPKLPSLKSLAARIHSAKAGDSPLIDESGWNDWVSVESSNLDQIRYNHPDAQLEVRFKNGSVYRYGSVPMNVYASLLQAPSKGSYLHHSVKNRYPVYKVR